MRYYLESPSTDPAFNLALEQYLMDGMDRSHSYCMLWRNDRSVIVGRHQNTLAELDSAYVRSHAIAVVRRLSGGGAVYHDLGNVNFTFVTDQTGEELDFSTFCRPVVEALASLGAEVVLSGRNDLTIGGKKCSGNAQYTRQGRVMHHGTILYDCDLTALERALRPPPDKLESRGIASVRSRVVNLRPYVSQPLDTEGFLARLREFLIRRCALTPYALTGEDLAAVQERKRIRYDRWSWNYGASPACRLQKQRRLDGVGRVEVHLDVEKGRIAALRFSGDFFGHLDPAELAGRLLGCPLEEGAIRARLEGIDVGVYIHRLSREQLCTLLLE